MMIRNEVEQPDKHLFGFACSGSNSDQVYSDYTVKKFKYFISIDLKVHNSISHAFPQVQLLQTSH